MVTHRELLDIDVDGYLDIARHLTSGSGFSAGNPSYPTAFRPPLYPLIVSMSLLIPGKLYALAVLQILMGMATVFIVGLIPRSHGLLTSWSLAAALIVALDPILIHVAATPMTETLCTFLIALWAFSLSLHSSRFHWVTGILLGLLILCRPTFLPFFGLQILCLSTYLLKNSSESNRLSSPYSLLKITAIQGFCILLCLLPWLIRNGIVIGKWTPATTHGGYTLLLANNETFYREVLHAPWGTSWEGDSLLRWQQAIEDRMKKDDPSLNTEPERDIWFYRLAFESIRNHPADFLQSCFWRLARLWDLLPQNPLRNQIPVPLRWAMSLWFSLLWFGMVIGSTTFIRSGRWDQLLLPLMILNVSVVHLFFWTDLRMRAPLIPLVAILAVSGWQAILSTGRSTTLTHSSPSKTSI